MSKSVCVCVCVRERKSEQRRKSLFDWPVVANCTLAKCSEEHVNHMK